jgi:hypothetical protein
MTRLKSILLAGLLLASLPVLSAAPALAQEEGECLTRREIQLRIGNGLLRQLGEVVRERGVRGKITSPEAEVCVIDGILQYRLNIIDDDYAQTLTLPAE